jgi:hypothetical protein
MEKNKTAELQHVTIPLMAAVLKKDEFGNK